MEINDEKIELHDGVTGEKIYSYIPCKVNDFVNHPPHYTAGDVECIDAIRASMSDEQFRGYLKGNTLKYIWRYDKKENPVEDLNKAIWYLEKLVEALNDEYKKQMWEEL